MVDKPAAQQIDDIIQTYGGWKGAILSQLRAAILETNTDIVEEIKWKMATRPEGLPVWTNTGIVCFAETWTDNIKLIFAKGSQLEDPKKLFNARLKSSSVRAIEFRESDVIDKDGLKDLIIEAVAINKSKAQKK